MYQSDYCLKYWSRKMQNMTSFEVLNKQPKLTVGYSVFTHLVVEVWSVRK